MRLSELIAEYGDDKVVFQKIDDCAESLNWSAKKGSRIMIRTMEPVTPDGTEKLGLVVWLDRKRVAEIIAKSKERSE